MSTVPENLNYTKDHEWALIEEGVATIGITDFAQSALGDIVFIELPEVGTKVEKGGSFGVVESIKSVSDLYAPIEGEVVEVNQALIESPELCNESAYDSWMLKIKFSDESQTSDLLSAEQYLEHCKESQ